jgi:hypothetical protein
MVLVLFVVGLGSGGVLALCESELSQECCCGPGKCPRPEAPATAQADGCCSPTDTSPPSAATLGATTAPSAPDPVEVSSIDAVPAQVSATERGGCRGLAEAAYPRPPLFTLHAILLI